MATTSYNSPLLIDDHGLLLIKGPDAHQFLQGQVTCDVSQLTIKEGASQSILGAHCTAKGRMLFSFRACALADDTIGLCIYAPLIPDALSALQKYSIFSKVELLDARERYSVIGVYNKNASSMNSIFPTHPATAGEAVHTSGDNLGGVMISLNGGDGGDNGDEEGNRYECWLPKEQSESLTFPSNAGSSSNSENSNIENNNSVNIDIWTYHQITQGIGEVRPETVEEFIPQMLNYQVVGQAISFKKGCYTGQEVVARMQYLGKLKRHMYRFSSNSKALLAAGSPLFTPGSQQSVGQVVISSLAGEQQQLLAVATVAAVKADQVFTDPEYQHKLQALPLPYAITKED